MEPMADSTPTPGFLTRFALRMRRITTSGRYLGELDGLRFIAIAWVVLHHIHTPRSIAIRRCFEPSLRR